jgi:hypothetical protein
MVRKLLVSAVTAAGLLSPLASAAPAQADYRIVVYQPVPLRVRPHCYHVYYRACRGEPWICYGRYYSFYDADAAAHFLQVRGFHVVIR